MVTALLDVKTMAISVCRQVQPEAQSGRNQGDATATAPANSTEMPHDTQRSTPASSPLPTETARSIQCAACMTGRRSLNLT
jgi:hypothetical protein